MATQLREVTNFIKTTTDPKILSEVLQACMSRRGVLETAAYEMAKAAAWASIADSQPGDLLYVRAKDVFIGDKFNTNTILYVNSIDLGNKEINISPPGGGSRVFGPKEVHRFNLGKQPI